MKIAEEIRRNPFSGCRFAGRLPDPSIERIKLITNSHSIDEIIFSEKDYSSSETFKLVDFCHENHIVFKFIPSIYQVKVSNFDLDSLNGVPLIELKRTALDGWGRVIKRMVDIITSIVGLVMLLPVFVMIAFIVKWETQGPVFVSLERVSGKRKFYLCKFRSMIENAEALKPHLARFNERKDGPLFKIKDDPRLTRFGKIIRKYRIDELPQFWNILKGDISLVGPRPHQPDEIERYQKHHKKVLAIKAGATGLAQVSGSSDLPFEQEVTLDSFYIDNWSLLLDLKIILKTMFKVFTDRSAV